MNALFLLLLALQGCFILANIALLALPVLPVELRLWRHLKVQRWRRYLTRRRKVQEPLGPATDAIARRNLQWHVAMTAIMAMLCARASQNGSLSAQLLATMTLLPSLAWLAGSIVQRQKRAILHYRSWRGAE